MSGCASVGIGKPLSKYQPNLGSIERVDMYIDQIVKPVNNQVVGDELGVYHHNYSEKNQILMRAFFNKTDEHLLRESFSGSIGLLAPVYRWSSNKLEIDWVATERRHKLFSSELKLNLRPLSDTRIYAKAFDDFSNRNGGNVDGYNWGTVGKILESLGMNVGYIINSGYEDVYFLNRPRFSRGQDLFDDRVSLEMGIQKMVASHTVSFNSVTLTSEARAGHMYMVSGCMSIDLANYKKLLKWQSNKSYMGFDVTPIYSRSNSSGNLKREIQKSKEKDIKELSEFYLRLMKSQQKEQLNTEKACSIGFAQLRISGSFSSSPLK